MISRRTALGGLVAWGAEAAIGCSGHGEGRPHDGPAPEFYWGLGIENTWMVQADPTIDGARRALDELALTGHDARWRDDFTLAKDVGATALRYGISWDRLEPEPGRYELDALVERLDYLRELGIEAVLDVLHYGTPAWLRGGIGEAAFPEALASYCAALGTRCAGLVRLVTPMNEPQTSASTSGLTGLWPPYRRSTRDWVELGLVLARAQVLGTRALRDTLPGVTIVSADPINWFAAGQLFPSGPPGDELAGQCGAFPASLAYGVVPPDGVFGRWLSSQGADAEALAWLVEHAEPPDVVGYNHYPDFGFLPGDFTWGGGGQLTLDEAAAQAAEGAAEGLRRAHAFWQKPVWLTETSAGLTAPARAAYARALGRMAATLLGEGVDLRGINWWPLFEAVHWGYREDATKPFADFVTPGAWNNGLYDLDATTLARVETEAAAAYREVVAGFRSGARPR